MVATNTQNHSKPRAIEMGRYNFERVDRFTYLGSLVTGDSNVSEEITNRLTAANRAYFELQVSLSHNYCPGRQRFLYIKHLWGQYLHTLQKPGLRQGPSICGKKILRRIYGLICEGGQWRNRYNRELEQLYNEPNIVNVIKSSRLRWAGHLCEWMKTNYLQRYCGQTLEVNEDVADRPKSRWTDAVEKDARKLGCRNWRADD